MPDAGASVTPSRPEAAAEAVMPSVRGARRSVGAEEDGAIRSAPALVIPLPGATGRRKAAVAAVP